MLRSGLTATLVLATTFTAPAAHGANCLAYLAADAEYERAIIPYTREKKRLEKITSGKIRRALRASKAREEKAKRDAKKAMSAAMAVAKDRWWATIKPAYDVYRKSFPRSFRPCVTLHEKRRRLGARFCNPLGGKAGRAEATARKRFRQIERPASRVKGNAERAAGREYRRAVKAAKQQQRRDANTARAAIRAASFSDPAMKQAQRILRSARRDRLDAYIDAYANPGPYRRKVGRYDRKIVRKVARHERGHRCPKW